MLGSTKLELSVIGLGTWAIGEEGYRKRINTGKDKGSIDTILSAMEMGVNWIDTAPSYGFGYSESVVGKAIKMSRKRPIISTKCGLAWKKNKICGCLNKKSIRSEIDGSLRRLGVGVIDLYQIHKPLPEKKIEQAWATIAGFVSEGKIRYAGVSNFSIEQLERIMTIRPVDFIQVHYSMLFQDIEKGLLAYCAKNRVGVVTYSPIERGLLSGKFSWQDIKKLPKHDHRCRNPLFADKNNFELVERLRPIALRNKMSMAQLAIAWILRHPKITSVIVGARFPRQIKETAVAADLTLSENDLTRIDMLLKNKNGQYNK